LFSLDDARELNLIDHINHKDKAFIVCSDMLDSEPQSEFASENSLKKKLEMVTIIQKCMLWLLITKCIVAFSDCDWVKIIYGKMGGNVSLIPQDCCLMARITCHDGHVIRIRWGYQGLNGYISPEIGNLLNLESL